MHLLIRRSQRDDGWIWSSMTFILKARVELTHEEKFLFDKYRLYDRVVYNSEDFIEHVNTADKYREEAGKADDSEFGVILSNSLGALWHNIVGKFYLQVTLQNLVDGITIETQDLEEMLMHPNDIHLFTSAWRRAGLPDFHLNAFQ